MNECYSGPTKGSAVQTRGKTPASPGQPSSSGLPHQNTTNKDPEERCPSPPPKHANAQDRVTLPKINARGLPYITFSVVCKSAFKRTIQPCGRPSYLALASGLLPRRGV
jgi:hypothetical protein